MTNPTLPCAQCRTPVKNTHFLQHWVDSHPEELMTRVDWASVARDQAERPYVCVVGLVQPSASKPEHPAVLLCLEPTCRAAYSYEAHARTHAGNCPAHATGHAEELNRFATAFRPTGLTLAQPVGVVKSMRLSQFDRFCTWLERSEGVDAATVARYKNAYARIAAGHDTTTPRRAPVATAVPASRSFVSAAMTTGAAPAPTRSGLRGGGAGSAAPAMPMAIRSSSSTTGAIALPTLPSTWANPTAAAAPPPKPVQPPPTSDADAEAALQKFDEQIEHHFAKITELEEELKLTTTTPQRNAEIQADINRRTRRMGKNMAAKRQVMQHLGRPMEEFNEEDL